MNSQPPVDESARTPTPPARRRSRRVSRLLGSLVALTGILNTLGFSQEPLRPLRLQDPPEIDGRLDDAAWLEAPAVSGFKTYTPDYGRDLVGTTQVRMAYDAENLFFAFQCLDNEPKLVKASMTSRDKMINDDWVCVNLDSFGDQQSLYAFYVNPLGIQGDSRFAANQEDISFDCVWYCAGVVHDSGYSVEMRIPLKSIRYAHANPVQMGVIFERRISRRSEQGTFPPLSPEQAMAFLTQMHPIEYENVETYTLFEVLPALTYTQRETASAGQLALSERKADPSVTVKLGVTSDLIVDGTYNPDFSQVEADAGQVDVNLRYNLFYPEKRPFFLEGNEQFTIGATSSSAVDPVQSIVYTRTIVDPVVGVKLTGKLGAKNSIALLYAVDEFPADHPSGDRRLAHVPIVRYKRSLSDDSFLGAIYAGKELPDRYNRVGGADGELRLGESSTVGFHGLYSESKPNQASNRQTGHALGLSLQYNTRDLGLGFSFKEISEPFHAEMGYITRTGVMIAAASATPRWYPDSETLRRISLGVSSAQTLDHPSGLWETNNSAAVSILIGGTTILQPRYVYSTEIFLARRFLTGGVDLTLRSQMIKELLVQASARWGDAMFYSADPYQGRSRDASAALTFQPWDDLALELTARYSDFTRTSNSETIYEISIGRSKLIYQLNRYLFFRGTLEYNTYRRRLLTDLLVSFTYIPGTVFHAGYGSLYERSRWERDSYVPDSRFLETQRGVFVKASYLWRI